MTVHVLHAGNGYDYLTRQVAHGDTMRGRGQDLADYYTANGAPPGRWMGSGLEALGVSGLVEEHQMKALFGEGLHPDAETRFIEPERIKWTAQFTASKGRQPTTEELTAAAPGWVGQARLGRRYPEFNGDREERWRAAVKDRYTRLASATPPANAATERELRSEARKQIGREFFTKDRGRAPVDADELRKFIKTVSRPTPQPVAGYDLVFTPAKSVSLLWGLGDDATRRTVEAAHKTAVEDAVGYLEKEAAFTRTGDKGRAQVESKGLVATAFDHYDSRAGDPNFHTHVAVANKVMGPDGKWRSLDGRVVHAAGVSASERYNAVIEREISARLGLTFEDRQTARELRPVREVAGIDPALVEMFSTRRNAIEDRFNELRGEYRGAHGHEPSKAVQHQLAQQATLDTRAGKEGNESLATKRERWTDRVAAAVGREYVGERLVDRCREQSARAPRRDAKVSVAQLADEVVDRVSQDRARWKVWHLRAEAQRQVAQVPGLSAAQAQELVDEVTATAVNGNSLLLEAPEVEARVSALTRANGESVFRVHGAEWFSSPEIFAAESRLLDAVAAPAVPVVDHEIYAAIVNDRGEAHARLDGGQRDLVARFATSDRLVAVGVGPAGAGKSTAMGELAEMVRLTGKRVIGLAPSAVAAQGLAEEIQSEATTIAKLLHLLDQEGAAGTGLLAGDLILVDEAGMASTRDLDRIIGLARERGCSVRLLGDPSQLSAVEAGGAFRLLVHRTEAVELTTLHRFRDPAEATATLGLRDGDAAAVDFYEDANRLHSGSRDGVLDELYEAWRSDIAEGRSSIMLAADSATVRELSTRARLERVAAGDVARDGVRLHDGSTAGEGDLVVSRVNDRRLATAGGRDFVKNGDIWAVKEIGADGSMTVQHTKRGGAVVTLPADYVRGSVELGYALTVHRAQGITVDRSRTLVEAALSRESLYVSLTRGREENHAYVATDSVVDVDLDQVTGRDRIARHVVEDVLNREAGERSATETVADAYEQAESLERLIPEYEYARGAAAALSGSVDTILGQALGAEQIDKLRNDPAWHTLADRVAALADEGADAHSVVHTAAARGGLDDAESPAAVLVWRINQNAVRGGLDDWTHSRMVREPSGSLVGLDGWMYQRAQRIRARVDDVTQRTQDQQPAWLTQALGQPPAQGSPAEGSYRNAVRAVAVYRDRYGITDTVRALGHEPTDGRQRRDWQSAGEALAAVEQQPTTKPAVDLAERARQLRERSLAPTAPREGPSPRDSDVARQRDEQERMRQQDRANRDDLEH